MPDGTRFLGKRRNRFLLVLTFPEKGTAGERSSRDFVLSAVIKNARRQSMCANNSHIGDGFHALLHPDAIEIGEYDLNANLLGLYR